MKFVFDNKIDNLLKIIVKCASRQNINVYFVGGIVRDYFLERQLKDIDLIVDSNAIEFAQKLPEEIKIKSFHKDFYTVKIQFQDITLDVASTRYEHYPYSGSLPVVDGVGVDIFKDYIRRDFSVNSLYAKISLKDNDLFYELIDYCHGLDDIKNKILRVLHNKSYIDDPTRIIRGVGFKYRFGFDFSSEDKLLIDNYLNNLDLKNASHDRILSVFKHVLSFNSADETFKDIVLNKYYKILGIDNLNCDFDLINQIIKKFNLINKLDFYIKILFNENVEKVNFINLLQIKKYFSKLSEEDIAYYFYKTLDDNALRYFNIKDINILATGDNLISLGYTQGKKIGLILDDLLMNKLNNPEMFVSLKDEVDWVIKKYPIST